MYTYAFNVQISSAIVEAYQMYMRATILQKNDRCYHIKLPHCSTKLASALPCIPETLSSDGPKPIAESRP